MTGSGTRLLLRPERRPGAICAYPCQRRENCHHRDGIIKQELLMRDCREVHPHALYMGVGGT